MRAFTFLNGLVAAFALLLFSWPTLACCSDELENPGAAVKVVDTQFVTGEESENPMASLTVLGALKNETKQSVNNIVVEAKLLDSNGQVVDVLNEELYGIVVMPGDQVMFRIQGFRASPKASYAQVQARVTSARSDSTGTKSKVDWLGGLAMWWPLFVLVAVLIWLSRKSRCDVRKSVAMQAEGVALMQRKVAALEKIANTMKE
jgi:hypothetical protein